ncbi:MAG: helix-turn-helix transcriptional regulator [Opitutaceae bacterium]|nr:helix-turn-helix transcriptional regulator [Opitutaceae bacterium]
MVSIIKNISIIDKTQNSPFICFGDVTYKPGGSCGPRIQKDYQLVIIHKGSAFFRIEDFEYTVSEGHYTLLIPGHNEMIQFSAVEPTHHTWCALNSNLVSDEIATQITALPRVIPVTDELKTLVDFGLRNNSPQSPRSDAFLEQLGLSILNYCLIVESLTPIPQNPLPSDILKTKHLIETQFHEPLSIESIAHEVGVSPNHLIRNFKKHLRITPFRYLWDVRIRHGIKLLTRTGLRINEIAERSGFQNAFHFSRMVKKNTGYSPRQLRQLRWGSS